MKLLAKYFVQYMLSWDVDKTKNLHKMKIQKKLNSKNFTEH